MCTESVNISLLRSFCTIHANYGEMLGLINEGNYLELIIMLLDVYTDSHEIVML